MPLKAGAWNSASVLVSVDIQCSLELWWNLAGFCSRNCMFWSWFSLWAPFRSRRGRKLLQLILQCGLSRCLKLRQGNKCCVLFSSFLGEWIVSILCFSFLFISTLPLKGEMAIYCYLGNTITCMGHGFVAAPTLTGWPSSCNTKSLWVSSIRRKNLGMVLCPWGI